MKKVITFLTLVLALSVVAPVQAQLFSKEENPKKERKEAKKADKKALKEIKSRAVRQARKEGRKLKKRGFAVFPGSMPADKQLERVWQKQYMENNDGTPTYLFADGNGVGKTQTSAEMQAMEAAKLQLAGIISNEINQIIESKIANEQVDRETGNSLTKFVAGGKNYIVQHLTYVRPGFKVYRNSGEADIEVFVKLYYNAEEAYAAAERALQAKAKAELEEEADVLIDEINRLLDR